MGSGLLFARALKCGEIGRIWRTCNFTGVQLLLLFSAMLHRPSWKRLVAVLGFAQSRNGAHNHGRTVPSLEQLLVAGRADRAGISAVQSSAILAAGRLLCSAVFEFALPPTA